MNDATRHVNIAEEHLKGAKEELKNKRFSNVGFLSMRALEQMIEACASKEGLHFHEHPRTAHKNRRNWLKMHHPDLLELWDQLWGIYGALGYGGLNGERAEQALIILKKCLTELSRREKIAIAGL
ncbi:MAG: hypothetical protein H3Z53_07570 [archaeon]|nr:hypothetical protein [archaeon]MCP8314211.1 hypothetical protein [archaeon]MCP8321009.1 hypothetical protein [archaeon]